MVAKPCSIVTKDCRSLSATFILLHSVSHWNSWRKFLLKRIDGLHHSIKMGYRDNILKYYPWKDSVNGLPCFIDYISWIAVYYFQNQCFKPERTRPSVIWTRSIDHLFNYKGRLLGNFNKYF